MCPEKYCLQQAHRQRGAGLPLAIFLITVMALIVATIAQLQQTTGEAESADILSIRAYYAAESGAQLGLVRALGENEEGKEVVSCFDEIQQPFERAGLRMCSSVISCAPKEPTNPPAVVITSKGICGSGNTQANRTIEVKAR